MGQIKREIKVKEKIDNMVKVNITSTRVDSVDVATLF